MHPRAARVPAAVRKDARVQQPEQRLPRRLVVPDRLETDQDRRDVVPGFRVQLDRPDVDRAELGPLLNHLAHAIASEDSRKNANIRANSGESCQIPEIFASKKRGLRAKIQRVAGSLPDTN